MIKNPKLGQTVCFFEGGEIKTGTINEKFQGAVEISYWYYRTNGQIYPSKELAQKDEKNEISKILKNLNKTIFYLSKKREKLASKLAKLLKKR